MGNAFKLYQYGLELKKLHSKFYKGLLSTAVTFQLISEKTGDTIIPGEQEISLGEEW